MSAINNVIVIGLGAIGSIYAEKLQRYDPNCIRVLIDETRLERYKADGIIFNGVHLDFNYVLPGPNQNKADLILIATKVNGLHDAINAIEGFVHDQTIILSLLNGITSEELIAERYGWDKVLHAFFLGKGSTRVGNVITYNGAAQIVFGDAQAQGHSQKVDVVRRFFDRADIAYEVPEDILFACWRKFILNVGINQASAVLRGSYGAFQRSTKAYAVVEELMQEALLIAQTVGIRNTDQILPWCKNFILNMPPDFKTSTLQDIESGHETEVDLFGGAVCALGRKYGIPTPHNEAALELIKALEEIALTVNRLSAS